jgi:hypothetical protein
MPRAEGVASRKRTQRGLALFDKAMQKSIEPHLQPGEELLSVAIVQGKGMMKAALAGGAIGQVAVGAYRNRKSQDAGASEGGIELASKMGIAVTSSRLLLFKAGGAVTVKAQELLTELPIAEVESMSVGKGALTKPITIAARGESFTVEAPKASNPDKLIKAYEQAKAGARAVA